MKKRIITIERQYGSGGSIIGKLVADRLAIPCYNRQILEMTAQKCGLPLESLENAEEKVPTSFLYSLLLASNVNKSYEDNLPLSDKVFIMESDIIRNLAKQEESFVLVGRCGNYILENEGCFRVFIYGNKEKRIKRAIEDYGISPEKAETFLRKSDKRRETFYNSNSGRVWHDKEQYELCLNSSELGDELCADIIVDTFKKLNSLK
ncbi:MAG: cytidylate kinase-like family protein [Oscillospiraceae bacterium]|nr:cytidylate kinase-like family protein [Oscillospiraceae bacterium]